MKLTIDPKFVGQSLPIRRSDQLQALHKHPKPPAELRHGLVALPIPKTRDQGTIRSAKEMLPSLRSVVPCGKASKAESVPSAAQDGLDGVDPIGDGTDRVGEVEGALSCSGAGGGECGGDEGEKEEPRRHWIGITELQRWSKRWH